MPIPLTPLERGVAKFFWDPLLKAGVSLERMIGGGADHSIQSAWTSTFARQLAVPARNYVNRIVDRGEDVLADSLSKGLIDPGMAGWAGGKLKAARQVMGLLDEHLQLRRVVLNQADAWANSVLQKHGLTTHGDEWFALRKMVEAGDLSDPRAAALAPLINQPRDLMRHFLSAAESKLVMNNWPVVVDAAKVANSPLAFRQVTDLLAQRVLSDEGLSSAAREALVLRQGSPLALEEVSDLIRELVMQETRMRFRPVQGYTRSPARIFARRLAREIPDEWRLHPFQEMMTGLHDEYSFLVDIKTFGRGGREIQTVVDWLSGVLKPEDYANLPKEVRESIKDLRALSPSLIQESNGPLFQELGGMIDRLARATTGSFHEEAWVWAARNGFAPAGAISMMAFSALPNMGQALTELIVRGFGPFKKGFVGGDIARARQMATLIGQHNTAMMNPDFHQGVVFNTALLKRPTKGPGAILKGELPSIFNPRWYVDNFGIIQTHGLRGMRSAAEEFLHATGFVGVEDWLRRGSVLAIEDEIASIQQRLLKNPADAWALRKMRGYGINDVEQFMQIKKPDLEAAASAFRSGDIDQVLSLKDWQKAYFHGVGGTQFNYLPGDFPMIFAHPLWGSVGLQFRRYSYSQATKVVSHILNEASAGNITPLLYAAATIPTGGEIIRRARDLVQAKDIVFVAGKPVYAEKPTVQRAKEVRQPTGGVMSVDQRRMMENVVAMSLMGAYSDALWTLAEDKPLLLASVLTGIFPSEVFNFISKLKDAGSEVVFGPEPGSGYSRVGGPKVQEAVRQTVREVPFLGRLVSPHVRWGRSRYQQLREHAMRTFVAGDFDSFNTIQRVLTEQFYAPVTIDDIVNREYRQALKEAGYTGTAPAPGDPSYIEYRQGREREGLRRKRPVSPADRGTAVRKSQQRFEEFFQRMPEEE